ncbi:hypothetical protein Tco_0899855 [Tanacetum coccineum]
MPRFPLDVCSPSFGAPRDRSYEIIATKQSEKYKCKNIIPTSSNIAIHASGKTRGEVGSDGLVASIARWRLMSKRFDKCCSSFRLLAIWFRVVFCGGEGCDEELVVIGEVGGVLLGGGDGGEGGRL